MGDKSRSQELQAIRELAQVLWLHVPEVLNGAYPPMQARHCGNMYRQDQNERRGKKLAAFFNSSLTGR